MQKELLQFKIQNVWILVDCPKGIRPIGTKWVLKNKKDERGIVIQNKARLVAQGHTQKKGINYEEVFAPVSRIEAIRLFLAYASFMGFTVYQMDVKSAFLYGTIDEETLFIRKHRGDFLLVQVYIDDIIFGSSNPLLCREFEALMHDKFQMSAMGELNFFLGLQVLQKKDVIFLSQDKYVGDILKKFGYSDVRSMIGSLMYLTASRPDIMFVVYACARYQVTPKEFHLHAIKRIFRYLKGHPKLGLWYPKEYTFDLVAYSDSDYGGATLDRKSTTGGSASGCGQVLWIQNQLLDYGLAFCDYHNMIAILDKSEHNIDFHQIVDFIEASHIRYALTINPTVYVSHILQFWSTARIETANEGTKILATVEGKPRTITESSIRRNLKLNDEEGISSLPDADLFENLALMRYNILPNQKFTFQKGQFSHQWKFLIHTIMQCLSPKIIGFNEFSSNITTDVVCLATNRVYNFSKMIFDGMGEGSGTPTKPHHTPSPQEQQSPHYASSSPLHPTTTTESIPTETPTETTTLRQYSRRATRIAQSKALSPAADEPASLLRDDSQVEAFLTARIKVLEDKDRGSEEPTEDDAPIKGRSIKIREEVGVERSTNLGSNDTEEMVNVLTSMEAANILTNGVAVVSVFHVAGVLTVGIPTVSRPFSTVSAIFTTTSVVTPYSRRPRGISAKDKGKEKVVESEEPKKKKLQEQIDAQVAKEIEEEIARENKRMNEQIARDAEIARIHAKEELKMMIEGLDRSNEMIAKHLQEYEQATPDLTIGEKIELINELEKYQDHHAKILKYQAQQSKPLSKKEQKEFYMSVLRSHAGWKTKHFRGMALEEIKEKFIPVWKQIEDFMLMSSKEEAERVKRKGPRLDQGSSKRMKTFEDVSEEYLKGMMQLVPVEEKLWAFVKETLSIRQATKDKEKELWVELKRLFEPESEDQLWTHTQNLMHDPLDWRLYDTCGVHHVFTKDQDIFMLVERDYPLRRGLAIVMICNKLHVENYSQMANDLILKIHNIAHSPR
uniref:Reverse transcriptase Ty1/copia-type domain-containing protein n=1 Tax=Tanacetum cinerariifolium TaxID=118510 RepID=A0A699IP70_TANCI|nr:hypothetical protein [Tanacetum cinerariifolium]